MNIVIKIYFQFYDGLLIVQFERIFINVIALIRFENLKCLFHALLEKVTIPHFTCVRRTYSTNFKRFFDHLLILNKRIISFLYSVDHVLTRWYGKFKTRITICIGKTFNNTGNILYPTSSQYGFEWLIKARVHWLAF